jgi:hypothetical protein
VDKRSGKGPADLETTSLAARNPLKIGPSGRTLTHDPLVRSAATTGEDKELGNLGHVLANPFSQSTINDWVGASSDRQKVAEEMYFGTIRWPKSVGRSTAPTLSQGFNLVCVARQIISSHVAGGADRLDPLFLTLPPPLVPWAGLARAYKRAWRACTPAPARARTLRPLRSCARSRAARESGNRCGAQRRAVQESRGTRACRR